jgi:hypothetical protein
VGDQGEGNRHTDPDALAAPEADPDAASAPGGMTRRRAITLAAKTGTAVAAAAWIAPKLESVAFAAGTQGSPCPDPGNPACNTTTSSSPTTAPKTVTCKVDPNEIKPGDKPRFFGSGWKPASKVKVVLVGVATIGEITVRADGTFSETLEVVRSIPSGTYRVEFAGFDAEGRAVRCFEQLVVSSGTGEQGSTSTSGGEGTGSNSSGSSSGSGELPFTGSDTGALVALGVGAVVVGRVLYGLRDRLAARDGDATKR